MIGTFLDNYWKYLDLATWLPLEYKFASGLMALSALAGRKVGVAYSTQIYYPNMYYMLVGPSNAGKGVAIDSTCQRLISLIDDELILPDRFTPEGLLKELSSRSTARGVVFNDEMADMLPAKKYMEGIVDILTSMYNTVLPKRKMRYSEKVYVLKEPYLSIFTGIQPDNVTEFISSRNVTSGFIPRFLVFYSEGEPRKRIDSRGAIPYWNKALLQAQRLYNALSRLGDTAIIPIEKDAVDLIYAYIDTINLETESENDRLCFRRLGDHLFKLSLLFYINNLTVLGGETEIYNALHKYIIPSINVSNVNKSNIMSHVYNTVDNSRDMSNSVDSVDISRNNKASSVTYKSLRNASRGVYMLRDTSTLRHYPIASVPKIGFDTKARVEKTVNSFISVAEVLYSINLLVSIKEGTLYVSRLITDEREARELEKCRTAISRLLKREKYIVVKGRKYLVLRDLVRALRVPVRRVSPYLETLQDEGILGDIKYLKTANNRRIKIIEYLGDEGSPSDKLPWKETMLSND